MQRILWEAEPGLTRRATGRAVEACLGWWGRRDETGIGTSAVLWVTGLQFGGAGRTPVTRWLASRADARGLKTAVVGHGYGGKRLRAAEVLSPDAFTYGDEAVELRRALPTTVPVWVGRPRAPLVRTLSREHALVVVDAAWPGPPSRADARVVVVNAAAPDRVFPAGPGRASSRAVSGDDLVWLHHADRPNALAPPRWAYRRAHVRSRLRVERLRSPDGALSGFEALRGRPVVALCGIAQPAVFQSTVESLCVEHGAHLVEFRARPDHHRFTPADLGSVPFGALCLTTEKDRARDSLPGWWSLIVDLEVEVLADHPVLALVGLGIGDAA
jgi:tetraacyldisaccharide 4'-kinase